MRIILGSVYRVSVLSCVTESGCKDFICAKLYVALTSARVSVYNY